ncbi:MAG: hypothetical protein MK013_01075 [Dehalococcoidia bacterium]|mgnify:FL=1|jgi:hypothetical protein|nr:hypothetical protein [Dehalococcoidia bacterium]|tara:strand:+ start:1643 stop:1804 length:162 start_codon:yes stop_codon:yes gene_type:complete
MIYSKSCPCGVGGDIKLNTDFEGKINLACIQCSKEISKSEAINMLKKLQTKVA